MGIVIRGSIPFDKRFLQNGKSYNRNPAARRFLVGGRLFISCARLLALDRLFQRASRCFPRIRGLQHRQPGIMPAKNAIVRVFAGGARAKHGSNLARHKSQI